MPYDLFTHATPEDQLSILSRTPHREKVVVVTMETMDDTIHEAGFEITIAVLQEKDHLLDRFLFVNKKERSPVWVTFLFVLMCNWLVV